MNGKKLKRLSKQENVPDENGTIGLDLSIKSKNIDQFSRTSEPSTVSEKIGITDSGSLNRHDNTIQLSSQNHQQSQHVSTANLELVPQEQSQQITISNENWASMRSNVIEMESLALHLRLGHNYQIQALQNSENDKHILVVRKDSEYKSICNTSENALQLSNVAFTKIGSVAEKQDQSIVHEEMTAVSNVPDNFSINNNINISLDQPIVNEEMTIISNAPENYSSINNSYDVPQSQPLYEEPIAVSATVQEDFAVNVEAADFLPEVEAPNTEQNFNPVPKPNSTHGNLSQKNIQLIICDPINISYHST